MKRITKQNLNDLAKVMPVLNEKQQFENVGGTYYVSNLSYEGLGFVGNSDVIYVISPSEFENAEATGDEYSGVALMGCDIFTQQMIFAAFALNTIGYNGGTEVVSLDNDPRPIFYDTYSGRLKFNVATSSGVWGCKAALEAELNSIRHTISGVVSGSNSGSTSGNMSATDANKLAELDSRLNALNHNGSDFEDVFEQHLRSNLAYDYYEFWQSIGYDTTSGEYTMAKACEKCKVKGFYNRKNVYFED
ncbi:MAG: hypothetical protein IJN45_03635 [Alistipes sp.]|nr:hypothetical protein [Alistipes sp.]